MDGTVFTAIIEFAFPVALIGIVTRWVIATIWNLRQPMSSTIVAAFFGGFTVTALALFLRDSLGL